MERRYLAATLALAATFAIFSGEFRSGHFAKFPTSRAELRADVSCMKHYVAQQVMAKLEPYLDRGTPERAQMLAELNLPGIVRADEKMVEAQELAARELALQKREATLRSQREAMKVQKAANERAIEVQVRTAAQVQKLQELITVRAQEVNSRAAERTAKINVAAMVRAQEAIARSMPNSPCGLANSGSRTVRAGTPIHINFQAPAVPRVSITVPDVPVAPTSF